MSIVQSTATRRVSDFYIGPFPPGRCCSGAGAADVPTSTTGAKPTIGTAVPDANGAVPRASPCTASGAKLLADTGTATGALEAADEEPIANDGTWILGCVLS